MPATMSRQDLEIRSSGQTVDGYDDTVTPSEANYETNPTTLLEDLNNLRSAFNNALNRNGASFPSTDWWADLTVPSALETGTARGVNTLNAGLHALEKKRVLDKVLNLTDVTVPASQNYVILGSGELPSETTAAVGAVTTLGTLVAFHSGTFGTHALDEIAGSSAISPKNLVEIVDGATRDPILSSDRVVWALLQSESNTNGHTISTTAGTRVQLSFVRINSAGNDLEAVPFADIQNKTINYATLSRVRFEDLPEQALVRSGKVDVPATTTVSRQASYTNQGTTPVDLTTNATLDLESAGAYWEIRDDTEARLFGVVEGSAGSTSTVQIASATDVFDCDAVSNDFLAGVTVRSGGSAPIALGVTDGTIGTTSGDLRVFGTNELYLDDGNQTASSWAQAAGIKLSDTATEWSDFETTFGEVSLLNAIVQAGTASVTRTKVVAYVTVDIDANNDASGPSNDNNLSADLGDLSGGTFLTSYDLYVNGRLNVGGADAAANNDYYPGTALANGQLRFEKDLIVGDCIALVKWV